MVFYGKTFKKRNLPDGESNPGLPRDRRGYLPLYYRGWLDIAQTKIRIFFGESYELEIAFKVHLFETCPYKDSILNKTQWNKPISPGLVATQNEHACFLVGRNSSVGRALDWRSKGPWFNPGFRHWPKHSAVDMALFLHKFYYLCMSPVDLNWNMLRPDFKYRFQNTNLDCRAWWECHCFKSVS